MDILWALEKGKAAIIGCGYGDLKQYLDQSFSDFTYIGIDQMPEFISEAKK
jgi:trans-aconitate methyltransferase